MNDAEEELIRRALVESNEDIALLLGSLANKRRLQILSLLLMGQRTFRELQESTGLGKTALAHHLKMLVEAGVLKHASRGLYRLTMDGNELLNAVIKSYGTSRRRREVEAAKRADHIERFYSGRREREVKQLEVSTVKLEPMRVATVRAVSERAEGAAWKKMRAWAEPKGLLEDPEKHPVFGFNDPKIPGRKEYGYEYLIRVGLDVKPEGDVQVKDFPGGLYAVTRRKVIEDPYKEIPEVWRNLADWVKSSKYEFGKHQWLEKHIWEEPYESYEGLVLDLYCPIQE